MITDFSTHRRNPGHWDIYNDKRRIFRIRGGPGCYTAMDERQPPYPTTDFKTLSSCMQFICEDLMHELIVAKGQTFEVIESWNI